MASLIAQYRQIIEKTFQDYADFLDTDRQIQIELVLDQKRDRYLLVETGWQNGYRIYGTLLHIDIIDQKIWIQHDGTEDGIADELVAAGIPQKQIILAFKSPEIRPYTDFAIA
jgi:hypothetical protein